MTQVNFRGGKGAGQCSRKEGRGAPLVEEQGLPHAGYGVDKELRGIPGS